YNDRKWHCFLFADGMVKRRSSRKKWTIFIVILVALVIAIRIALPYVILHYANKTQATMDGYRGHINDIDLAIIRGAYNIDSIYLHKYASCSLRETPFFAAKTID